MRLTGIQASSTADGAFLGSAARLSLLPSHSRGTASLINGPTGPVMTLVVALTGKKIQFFMPASYASVVEGRPSLFLS